MGTQVPCLESQDLPGTSANEDFARYPQHNEALVRKNTNQNKSSLLQGGEAAP